MAEKETYYHSGEKKWQSRETKTAEDVEKTLSKERLQSTEGIDTSKEFSPPKQEKGEALPAWMVRVRKARAEHDATKSQSEAARKAMEK